ncbi:aminotransferase class I/II [Hydrogenovibrio sp. SC-1]|uniref:MalY/PatB family protein n=1 Tax=Hydrogenovibrio sp. SC-1 TaxID=2065820 RepID=UPI000C79FF21|nr:PatB family C-S lyase [Hydrogenovibrio sp. SC-1]PLA75489.1 aminotransferase class I/II [Hydrogenovibrio sp. SC-1]
MTDFNQSLDRLGTDAEKYELRTTLFGTDKVLPMWVADQDLATPDFIVQALQNRLTHPVLGYTLMSDRLYQAIINWQAQYHYDVKASEIVFTHNVANGFHLAVQAFTEPGDAVLVQTPVYPPFLKAAPHNQRKTVTAPLQWQDGHYQIDFEALESIILEQQVKLLLFCHPQNPSGRVWQKSELLKLAELCLKHQVLVVSDEIHADMTFAPHQHVPMASLSAEIAQNTVTLSSPGKTFNLGGLQTGYAIIANPRLRRRYIQACQSVSILEPNLFANVAMEAAYSEDGKSYRDELVSFLQDNIQTVTEFFQQHFPQVGVVQPQASFLIWLDFSALFSEQSALKNWLIHEAGLGLNDGETFGENGTGFMRMNIAVSPSQLAQALSQLETAKSALPNYQR